MAHLYVIRKLVFARSPERSIRNKFDCGFSTKWTRRERTSEAFEEAPTIRFAKDIVVTKGFTTFRSNDASIKGRGRKCRVLSLLSSNFGCVSGDQAMVGP
jgi:hypothetical protein